MSNCHPNCLCVGPPGDCPCARRLRERIQIGQSGAGRPVVDRYTSAATPLHPAPRRCDKCGIPLLAMYVSQTDPHRCGKCVLLDRHERLAREAVEAAAKDGGPDAA